MMDNQRDLAVGTLLIGLGALLCVVSMLPGIFLGWLMNLLGIVGAGVGIWFVKTRRI